MKDSTGNTSYKTALEILQIYFNKGLPKKLRNEVKSWLVSDFHAEEKQAALWELWDNIHTRKENNKKKTWKAIKQKTGVKTPVFYLNLKHFIQVAAIIIATVSVITVTYYRNTTYKKEIENEYVQVKTAVTTLEPLYVLLEDGSEVWLNEKSELLHGNGRKAHLKGEALFKIKKDEQEEFIIHINDIKIRVIGTSFNVRSYPETDDISITLYEGKLAFTTPDTSVMMQTGEHLTFNLNHKTMQHIQTYQSEPGWIREYVVYNDNTLQEIFKDLENKYQVKISGGENILNDTLTLKFDRTTSLEEIMFLLSQLNGKFDYTIENNLITIY